MNTPREMTQQEIEDEEFNASVWDNWEEECDKELARDLAIADSGHPIHLLDEYHANCM